MSRIREVIDRANINPISFEDIYMLAHDPSYQPNEADAFTMRIMMMENIPTGGKEWKYITKAAFTMGYLLGVCRKEKRRVSAQYAKTKIKKMGLEIVGGI